MTIVNDEVAEEDEELLLILVRTAGLAIDVVQLAMSDGSACQVPEGEIEPKCFSTLTILADDDTPLLLDTATVDGDSLVLTYDKDLEDDEDSQPDKSAFAVSTGAISTVAVSGKTVTVTLATAVTPVGHGDAGLHGAGAESVDRHGRQPGGGARRPARAKRCRGHDGAGARRQPGRGRGDAGADL